LQITIKYTNKIYPNLDVLVWKLTIWQHCFRDSFPNASLHKKTIGWAIGSIARDRSSPWNETRPGVDVMITIFLRFLPIFGEKIGVFLPKNVKINFLQKLAVCSLS
jgi:hypothetical protein